MAVVDRGKRGARRLIAFRVSAPGYGLPARATFEYRELYERRTGSWALARYAYEYRPHPHPSRRAYHLHPPVGEHQHCVPARGASARHFRAYRIDLLEAHAEFTGLHASGVAIDCEGLHPLFVGPSPRRRSLTVIPRSLRDTSRSPALPTLKEIAERVASHKPVGGEPAAEAIRAERSRRGG